MLTETEIKAPGRNVERINELADAIEQGRIVDRFNKPIGFNMRFWNEIANPSVLADISGRGCGTVACIGGSAEALFRDNPRYVLGLTEGEANALFEPQGTPSNDWHRIPLSAAVSCLRHLAATGEVDWPRALAEHPLLPVSPT